MKAKDDFPLWAPECPYCHKTTARRRRVWDHFSIARCRTSGCGAQGELVSVARNDWLWSKYHKRLPTAEEIQEQRERVEKVRSAIEAKEACETRLKRLKLANTLPKA